MVSQSLHCRPDVPHPDVPNTYMFAALQNGGGVSTKGWSPNQLQGQMSEVIREHWYSHFSEHKLTHHKGNLSEQNEKFPGSLTVTLLFMLQPAMISTSTQRVCLICYSMTSGCAEHVSLMLTLTSFHLGSVV